jgi:hypothetical protein
MAAKERPPDYETIYLTVAYWSLDGARLRLTHTRILYKVL